MDAKQDTQAPRTRRWTKVLLVVSLALNLLILGIVGGAVFGLRDPDRPPHLRDLSYGPYTKALSREDRKAIGETLRRENGGAMRAALPQIRERYADLLAALRSDPYDSTAVEAIMREQQALALQRQDLGQRLLLERLQSMTTAERAGFADRLEEALKHGPVFSKRTKPDH